MKDISEGIDMKTDDNLSRTLALAMIAGAKAIEENKRIFEIFEYSDTSILYKEAAILLREKAGELISQDYLNDEASAL